MHPVLVANRLINLDYCIRAVIGPDEPESVPEGEVRAVMYPGVTLTFRGEDASLLRRYLEALAVGAPHGAAVPPDAGPGAGTVATRADGHGTVAPASPADRTKVRKQRR